MLSRPQATGFTLVEVMVTLTILAVVMLMAGPPFSEWMHNTRLRGVAESLQTGLQLARGEAVRRNLMTEFRLTTTTTNACAASPTGTSWVISMDDPAGNCAAAPSTTVAPRIVSSSAGSSVSTAVQVDAGGISRIVFDGLGRMQTPAATVNINVTNPAGGACEAAGGPMHCLRVQVTVAGQSRVCDPRAAATDPRGCP